MTSGQHWGGGGRGRGLYPNKFHYVDLNIGLFFFPLQTLVKNTENQWPSLLVLTLSGYQLTSMFLGSQTQCPELAGKEKEKQV